MSELVERLRERGANWRKQTAGWMLDPRISQIDPPALMAMVRSIDDEAADRIAELEARAGLLEAVVDAARNVVRTEGAIAGRASMRVLTRRLAALRDAGGA